MQRKYTVKVIANVLDWLCYAGGALIKVPDSACSTLVQTYEAYIVPVRKKKISFLGQKGKLNCVFPSGTGRKRRNFFAFFNENNHRNLGIE